MLISNLGALGLDKKKTLAKAPVRPPAPVQPPNLIGQAIADAFRPTQPLLANKGTGEKDLNFENENGEIRRGSPKGPKVYKFTASLANGLDIDFESDRDLTDEEIQGVVNEYSKTPGYQQVAQKYAKNKKARDNTPVSTLGPYDNRKVAINNQADYEQKQAKIASGELRPNGQPTSGFDLSGDGIMDSMRRIVQAIPNAVESANVDLPGKLAEMQGVPQQAQLDMRNMGRKAPLTAEQDRAKRAARPETNAAKRVAEAAQFFVPVVGPIVGIAGLASMVDSARKDFVGTAKQSVDALNPFADGIDPLERGLRSVNLAATVFGAYHGFKTVKGGIEGYKQMKAAKLDTATQIKMLVDKTGITPEEAAQALQWADEASSPGGQKPTTLGTIKIGAVTGESKPIAGVKPEFTSKNPTSKTEPKVTPTVEIKPGVNPNEGPKPNEKTNQQTIRNVQEGQGIRDQGEQPQGQGNGQKANAFPQEKGQVTAESVGVKSGMQDPYAGKTGVWKGPDADQPIKIEKTLGTKDGRAYVKVEGSNTGIPLDEITVDAPKPPSTRTRASAQKAATAEPTATPKVDTPDPKGAAISNKFFRDQTDADVPDADKQTVQQWIDAAVGAGHNTEAGTKRLVDAVLDGKKRDFTESEGMGIAARLTDLLTEKGTKGIDPARKTAIEAEIQRIAEATKKTGTNQARAFVSRAMLVGHDYSPEGVYRSYELAGNGKGPDAGIRAQLDAAIQRNAELTKLLDAKEKGATVTKGDIAILDEVARQRGKVRKVQDAQERLDAIRAKRAAGARGMGPSSGKGPRVRGALDFGDVADLKELAGAYAQMGVAKFQHFVDKVRGDFKEEFAHLSDADIAEALSQKTGDARTLEQKLIQQNVARLKREAQYIDEGASRLTKPAQQLRQVQKQIADVQARIDSGNVKTKPMTPPELKAARSELAKLKAQEQMIATNASKPTKAAVAAEQEAKRIESQQAKLDTQIADIKKRLDANDLSTPPGKPKKPADPALKSRLDELTKLRAEMEVKRKAARDAAKPPKVANDPVAKELERIRKESEAIQARIDAGTPKGPDPSKPVDPAVAYARQEINKLRAQERELLKASEAGFDRKNIDQWRNIQKKIAQTEYRIESGNVRGSKVRDTPEVIKEQQKILADLLRQEKMLADGASSKTKDIRYREQVQKQIDDYENQLKTGVYKDRSKPKMKASVELEALRNKRDAARLEIDGHLQAAKALAEYERMNIAQKAWVQTKDASGIPKALQAMADVSAVGNQTWELVKRAHVRTIGKGIVDMNQSFSKRGFGEVNARMKSDAAYSRAQKAGVHFQGSGLMGEQGMTPHEKLIFTKLRGKIPGVSHVEGWSERTFNAYLNRTRLETFKMMEATATRLNGGKPLTEAEAKVLGEYVNVLSGRGTGKLGELAELFYAPRFALSQAQTAVPGYQAAKAAFKGGGASTRAILGSEARGVAGQAALLATGTAAAAAFGGEVDMDKNSTNFGHLLLPIPNSKGAYWNLDLMGGRGSWITLGSRMVSGEKVRTHGPNAGGKKLDVFGFKVPIIMKQPAALSKNKSAGDVALDFARNKSTPVVGMGIDMVRGKTPLYTDFNFQDQARGMVAPLSAQAGIRSAYETNNPFIGAIVGMLNATGLRVDAQGGEGSYTQQKAEATKKRKQEQKLLGPVGKVLLPNK